MSSRYNYVAMSNRKHMSMFMAPTDPFEVLNIINSLKNKHSTGHDNISTSFLKDIKGKIVQPLSIIINKSLCEGIFPELLKDLLEQLAKYMYSYTEGSLPTPLDGYVHYNIRNVNNPYIQCT